MKNLSAIPRGTLVFVDTNILVLAGAAGGVAQQCRDFLNRLRERQVIGFTTTLVVAEVIHRVMVREAREQLGLSSASRWRG
jgi:predicted nucleic acid-binding protein